MRPPRRVDPFAALGLPADSGLTDDEVRAAWRRVATATHPDREDGGDPERFAAAAAAYTALRTPFGRTEALADLAEHRQGPRGLLRRGPGRGRRPGWWRPRIGAAAQSELTLDRGPAQARESGAPGPWESTAVAGEGDRRAPGGRGGLAGRAWLELGQLWSRVRRGRPARLALRVALAAGACAGVAAVAGARPATPALVTGAVTWLALTAHHDLAPPR